MAAEGSAGDSHETSSSGGHGVHASVKSFLDLSLSILGALLFDFVVLLLDGVDGALEVRDQLDEEGHGEFCETESPGDLENLVRLDEFVTGVGAHCEELLLLILGEEQKQVFDQLGVLGLLGSLDGVLGLADWTYLVVLVLLGDLDRLLVLLVTSVDQGRDSSEVFRVVFLDLASQLHGVDAVIRSNRLAEGVEVSHL